MVIGNMSSSAVVDEPV